MENHNWTQPATDASAPGRERRQHQTPAPSPCAPSPGHPPPALHADPLGRGWLAVCAILGESKMKG
jgi:hypothetical protein